MNAPKHRSRLVAAAAGLAGLVLVAGACGDDPAPTEPSAAIDTADTTDTTDGVVQVSAADGAAARAERDAVLGRAEAPLGSHGAESSALTVATDQPIPTEGDCGIGGEPYVPTAEEIAAANADTDALAIVLDTYGITYERIVDDLGFAYLETDYTDVVAQSVVDSFWADRYPPEPIDPAELDRIRAENDRIAAALDAAGVAYTRHSDDSGWEWLEWDYENAAAQEAVEAVYAELYPPVPPSAEESERMRAENDRVAAAFDAAGIAYTRMTDEAGWEWIEWDYEDPAASEAAQEVFEELYPPMPMPEPIVCVEPALVDPIEGEAIEGEATEGEATEGEATEGEATEGEATEEAPVAETLPAPGEEPAATSEIVVEDRGEIAIEPGVDSGFTPREIRRRDAAVAAMDAGFAAAGVEYQVVGESPWASVVFDIANPDAVGVIADILAQRG
ncbi:MAG: hypothetical protein ACE367_16110 [Acidimicrobiales bacterium]